MNPPDLSELLAMRGAARDLQLTSRRPAHALHIGGHRSIQRGRGLEFQEVRPYVNGDDPRTIDWRVTARRGRPHTKVFREERERPVWLLVDLNAGMFFGTRRQLKSSVALRATALLAWSATAGGDRVGAIIAGPSTYKIVPPRAREAGVLPVLSTLLELQPTAPETPRLQGLNEALRALGPLVHPGSLVLVLSDFAALKGDLETAWTALAAHNEFQLFWITDPLERQALPPGRFRIGTHDQSISIDGAATRGAWMAKWQERTEQVARCAGRLEAPVTQLDTSQSVEETLGSVFARRAST